MTTQDIFDTLQQTLDKLDDAGINDRSRRDLNILVLQLENEMIEGSFDSLKELDSVSVANTSKLSSLVAQVQTEIDNETARAAAVQQIISIAKVGLKAAGIPV